MRLSIGAKWTLRTTVAFLGAATLLAFYTYGRIDRRLRQDARLFLELQMDELAQGIAVRAPDAPYVRESAARSTLIASSDLKLGLQVFRADGTLLHAHGSLLSYHLDAPNWLANMDDRQIVREVDFGDSYPYVVISKQLDDGTILQGAIYLRRFIRNARDVRDIFFWTIPLAIVVTLIAGAWLVRGALRPIAQISSTARRITATHLDEGIPTTGSGDELDQLATTLNDMIGRLRDSVRRMQRFSANAAHELRTPLNALRSRLEVTLEQERTPDEYRKVLFEASAEVESLSESVQAMMRLAQSEAGLRPEDRVPVAVAELLGDVVDFFRPLAEEEGVALETGALEPASVQGEPAWLHQCFANLVDNAIRYTPEGGRVRVECTLEEGGAAVSVRVRDDGIGIPLEEQQRIFEPYHRVRTGAAASRPGAGIGLALVREIARAHDGDARVESRPGGGSTFEVRLPVRV